VVEQPITIFAACSIVLAYVMANLMGDGEHLFTVWQVAIHGDVLWLVVRVQITTIVGREVITIFDSEAKIFGQVENRAYGALVHFSLG